MKVIECMSEDIEQTLDMAEENIQAAIKYKETYPAAAKAFYTKSIQLMDGLGAMHEAVVTLIKNYRTEKGEPPAPMLAIYNYMHERQMNQAALIKNLQEVYTKN